MTTLLENSVYVKCLQKETITVYRNRKLHSLECHTENTLCDIEKYLISCNSGKILDDNRFLVPDDLDGRKLIKSINDFECFYKTYNPMIRNQCNLIEETLNALQHALAWFHMHNLKDSEFYGKLTANYDGSAITICKTGSKSIIGKLDLACSYLQVLNRKKVVSNTLLYVPIIQTKDDITDDMLPF